jgi:hypothetical protein
MQRVGNRITRGGVDRGQVCEAYDARVPLNAARWCPAVCVFSSSHARKELNHAAAHTNTTPTHAVVAELNQTAAYTNTTPTHACSGGGAGSSGNADRRCLSTVYTGECSHSRTLPASCRFCRSADSRSALLALTLARVSSCKRVASPQGIRPTL